MNEIIKKCVKNTILRIENQNNRMNAFSYIKYFCKKNNLSIDEEFYIREQVSQYIDENANRLFPVDFTINKIAC